MNRESALTKRASLPPAAWYDDPDATGTKRYWDGTHWTDLHARAATPDEIQEVTEPGRTVRVQTEGEVSLPRRCVACAEPIGCSTHTRATAGRFLDRGTPVALVLRFPLCETCGAAHDRVRRAWRKKKLPAHDLDVAHRVDGAVSIKDVDVIPHCYTVVKFVFSNDTYADAFELANGTPAH